MNSYFHQFNLILPYIRTTKILAQKIDCGSIVSNFIGKNKAKVDNKPYPSTDYGYPFFNEDECYSTFEGGKLETKDVNVGGGIHKYSDTTSTTSGIRGFLNNY